MSTPDPVPPEQQEQDPPAAIQWLESRQLRALLTVFFSALLSHLGPWLLKRYNLDISVLGLTAADLAQWTLWGLSVLSLAWAARVRVKQKHAPQITLTKKAADDINTTARMKTLNPDQPPGGSAP